MKRKDNDSLLDVIGSISKISWEDHNTHKVITSIHDDKTIKSSKRFDDCVIGFLEQKVDKLKANVDKLSKSTCFLFQEQFQLSDIEKKCIQFAIAMNSIDELGEFFINLFHYIASVDYFEYCKKYDEYCNDLDDVDVRYLECELSLTAVLSLILDIESNDMSEAFDNSLVIDSVITLPTFTLNTGVRSLLKLHENYMR